MKPEQKPCLIVVLGPTASGKTSLAIQLARQLNTEVISADSRQFYKEIPIGTAAPTVDEMLGIKHHFVGQLSIEDAYNISKFESQVLNLLDEKFKTLPYVILAGGSGLYIDAVCKGIDELPDPDPDLRKELNDIFENEGLEGLGEKLKSLDPQYHKDVDLKNSKRLIRAIEVCIQTGKTYTELRKNQAKKRDFQILKIGLQIDREMLNQRISQRTDEMMASGWLEEVQRLLPYRNYNALNTVGYKELFSYLDGSWTLEKAVEKIKTNTRRYAKRQMTWFRRDHEIHWLNQDQLKSPMKAVIQLLEGINP